MDTLTIKQAKELGKELVLGTAVKSKVTTAVHALYIEYARGLMTDKPLIALWEQCATDKPTLAVIRSIFNRVTKAVHKELGIDKPAMCVKDGKLVEVQKRGGNGGAEGGEGTGEGEHVMNDKGEAVPTKEQTKELMAHLKVLAELHDKSNDVAVRSALKFAIANLV